MKKNYFFSISLLSLAIIFNGCSGTPKEDKKDDASADSSKTKLDTSKNMSYKIYSLPAPMQLPTSIRHLSEKFNEEYLHPSDITKPGAADYNKKALILGIFGVDMGYCSVYDQNQAAMNYMSKMARLSQDLNITGAFDANVISRLKASGGNKDSASFILLSSFYKARSFLKTNKREEIGYLIAAGSLIEGLHMTTSIVAKDKSKEAMELIGMQKSFLESTITLLNEYAASNEGIKNISDKLTDLKTVYDQVKVEMEPGDRPNIQKIKSVTISDEQLASITKKVDGMRKAALE